MRAASQPHHGEKGSVAASLFGDLQFDPFLRQYWERKAWSGTGPFWLGHHIPSDLLETLIGSLTTCDANWIQVVRDGKGIAASKLTNSEGFVDLGVIRHAYGEGFTIQLSKMQIRHPQTGILARSFEGLCLEHGIDLARPIGSHLYITPPHSRGLLPHYDDHNVFVMQLAGTKHWRLYEAADKPLGRQAGNVGADDLPPLSHEIALTAGQILYLPRGCYHEACTEAEDSVHLTLDVYPLTMSDLLINAAKQTVGLAEALEPGLTAAAAGQAAKIAIEKALTQLDFGQIVASSRSAFRSALYPLPGSNLIAQCPVKIDSTVRHREGAVTQSLNSGEQAVLEFAGARLVASGDAKRLFDFVAETPRFVVSQLPLSGSDEEKIEFTRSLVENGALEVCSA